jgi:hypothetical protein
VGEPVLGRLPDGVVGVAGFGREALVELGVQVAELVDDGGFGGAPALSSAISLSCSTPRQTCTVPPKATAPPATGSSGDRDLRAAARARLRELRTAGQRTPAEMIDRHHLACQPIRALLINYLQERQPALDYGSLEQLARRLGMFWADLEAHHPGIDSLHLPPGAADAWKRRLRTKPKTIIITTAAGAKTMIDAERICHREFLTPVRAFYLDPAQWAVEDPSRWARWVAPCPVGPPRPSRAKSSGTASPGWTPGPASGCRSCPS